MKQLGNIQMILISISLALAVYTAIINIVYGENYTWQLTSIIWIFNYYRVAKILDNHTDY